MNITSLSHFAVSLTKEGSAVEDSYNASYSAHLVQISGQRQISWESQKIDKDHPETKLVINQLRNPSSLQIKSTRNGANCTLISHFHVLCQDGKEAAGGLCRESCKESQVELLQGGCILPTVAAAIESKEISKALEKPNPYIIMPHSGGTSGADEVVLHGNAKFKLEADSVISFIDRPRAWLSIGKFHQSNISRDLHAPLSFSPSGIKDSTVLKACITINSTAQGAAQNLVTLKNQTVQVNNPYKYL